MRSRGKISSAAVADGVALSVFVLVGVAIHGTVKPVAVLRDAAFLLPAWYAAAGVLRLYRTASWRIFLLTWGLGIPLGILLRQVWVGRLMTRATVAFLITALVLTLVFLIAGRGLAMLAARVTGPSS